MIYDCFIFHNELELLELRLMELFDKVDCFVLCEGTHTFRGDRKPLHFGDNIGRYRQWLKKIRHIIYPSERHTNPWLNEFGQRDYLVKGLFDADKNDVVMLSDVDEIPNTDLIPDVAPEKLSVLVQKLYYYYVNGFQDQPWPGTLIGSIDTILPFSIKRRGLFQPHRVEGVKDALPFTGPRLIPGGWHFSFLGGIDKIQQKIESYSEMSTDIDEVKDRNHLEHCIETGADLFMRKGLDKCYVPLNDTFPRSIGKWLRRYPDMVKPVGEG